jgi:hypothetical protein
MKAKRETFYPFAGPLLVLCYGLLLYRIINDPYHPTVFLSGFMPLELWNISALQPQLLPSGRLWMWSLFGILLIFGAVSLMRRSWMLLFVVPGIMLASLAFLMLRFLGGMGH